MMFNMSNFAIISTCCSHSTCLCVRSPAVNKAVARSGVWHGVWWGGVGVGEGWGCHWRARPAALWAPGSVLGLLSASLTPLTVPNTLTVPPAATHINTWLHMLGATGHLCVPCGRTHTPRSLQLLRVRLQSYVHPKVQVEYCNVCPKRYHNKGPPPNTHTRTDTHTCTCTQRERERGACMCTLHSSAFHFLLKMHFHTPQRQPNLSAVWSAQLHTQPWRSKVCYSSAGASWAASNETDFVHVCESANSG